jgi:membrane protease YdiL (CAAX protease family)
MAIPAGWYPDGSPGGLRYWDGIRWTTFAVHRLEPPRPPHPELPLSAAVGAIVAMAVPIVASRFLLRSLAHLNWPIAAYVAVITIVGYGPSLLWCWYVARRWGRWGFRSAIGAVARWSDLGWGPITWLACFGTQITVGLVVLITGIPFTGNIGGAGEITADRGYVISLLVVAVVAAPIAEEIVFRGVVLRGLLSRMGAAPAIALQAVVFGLAHVDPRRGMGNIGLALMLASVGGVLGGAAYLLRRIGPGMIAHALLNGLALTLALTGWLSR